MRIVVVGAAGMVGSRVVTEAAGRGHDVVGVFRSPPTELPPGVTAVRGDAIDRDRMRPLFAAADGVAVAIRPAAGAEHTVVPTTTALLDAAGRTRILIVGGAGPLRLPGRPDRWALDSPRYVAAPYRTIAAASAAQLDACRAHPADWVYLSPPAVLAPGARTGGYRRGTGTLLVDATGESWISAEDLAVAVVDELERPGVDRHVTVAHLTAG